ncbi:two-component regulator propeller domain-containing protein [Flavobacteriaceae bacterium SZ-1-7]|uniref:type IX secretion system anionic LPS delivery protein PorZ n=1 Tax=Tamlana sedimenti TaxID=3134126 RepID=UPI003128B37A
MFKRIVVLIVFLLPLVQFSQDFSALWQGHFSYRQIKDVTQGNGKIFAAAENAIFRLDTETNEMTEMTTVNGLSGETISSIYYSDIYELLVVGYVNGLIEIVFDNDENVLTIVDIINKPTIPSTDKKINHFNGYQNVLYVSTNFGISVFDLERLEFGDTYFIGSGGSQVQVTQTTIYGDYIYASCLGGNGIKKALVSSPNLIDFQNWQSINSGNWLSIEAQNDKLYAINTNRKIYQIMNDALIEVFTYSTMPQDLRFYDENLVVTTLDGVFVYDSNLSVLSQVPIDPVFSTKYVCATIDAENIYIGTNDYGILKAAILNPTVLEEIHPQGPLLNTPFSLQTEPNGLWVTFGEYDQFYNPYPLNNRGISHLKNDEWINNDYSEVFEAKCLNSIAINPFNNDQVFISSFFSGLLEVNDEVPTILYNETNSGLESLVLPNNPNYIDIRVGASSFDRDGLLWLTSGIVENQLKTYNPSNKQWKSYSFKEIIASPGDNNGFSDVIIDNNRTKWIGSLAFGLIGFNETNSGTKIKAIYKESENMPIERVSALALDKRNQLWIGTYRGLRVLYNTSNFFDDNNPSVDEIIIEEDGIAKELLFQQYITDIKVDGSNNKWIGTVDSGLFYFSPNGQKTIFHFTKDNSPLPSNSIRDISLDDINGIVYIATTKGLVSFRSGGSSPFEDLESAYAYPNPVRPGFNIVDEKVKIKDISENVNIKITDIEGNLVAEAQSRTNQRYSGYNLEIDGGTAYWNGKNLANNVVASGVYLIMLSDLDSYETKVLKLMVVR